MIDTLIRYVTRHNNDEPLFLKTREHEDGVSTVLMYKDKEFALHSWYSREFNFDEFHRERILNLFQEALDKKNK